MQFSPEFEQDVQEVEIIEKNRRGGVDVLASGVRILILPLERTPQEITIGRDAHAPRFGGALETSNAEIKRNRQIRLSDNTVYNIVEVYDGLGEMQIELESEGTP